MLVFVHLTHSGKIVENRKGEIKVAIVFILCALLAIGLTTFALRAFRERKRVADEEFSLIYDIVDTPFGTLVVKTVSWGMRRGDSLLQQLALYHGNARILGNCGQELSVSHEEIGRGFAFGWKCSTHGFVKFSERWVSREGLSLMEEDRLNRRLNLLHDSWASLAKYVPQLWT